MKKFYAVLAVILVLIAVYAQIANRPYLGETEPLKAPGMETTPPRVVSTSDPDAELWDFAYSLAEPLQILYKGNVAVDVDVTVPSVLYSIWLSSVNGFALDAAMLDYAALESWQEITVSLTERRAELAAAFAEAGRGDVAVSLNLVDPHDFTALLASATPEGLSYDIVEQTPPGEKVSDYLYADSETMSTYITNTETLYIVNRATKVFHRPTCVAADQISPKNRYQVRTTLEHLIVTGYTPCEICKP